MSAAQGRDRRRPGPRAHLVLLRGGLDHEDGGPCRGSEDADWRSFCERIGWQHVEAGRDGEPSRGSPNPSDLPDDYEDRLLARIFDDGAPASCSLRAPPDRRPRRDPADAAALAFAAALAVAASVMLWRAYQPPVSAVACPDVEAPPPRAKNVTPVVDSKDPTEPIDRRRDPAPRPHRPGPRNPPPGPSPSDARPERPTDPGSRLARVSSGNPVGVPQTPPVSLGNAVAMGNPYRAPQISLGNPYRVPQTPPGEIGGPMAPPEGVILASAAPAIPRVPSSEGWTGPTRGVAPPPRAVSLPRVDAPALGTWSLSPSSPRWYGVGLPSAAPAGVPSGLGVMAQLDVGKALDGL